jgi:D-alanine-D-alanine ligase
VDFILRGEKRQMKKIKLAVLFGGKSNEHAVSCNSGEQVICHLNPDKYLIKPVFISESGDWFIPKTWISPSETFSLKDWKKSLSKISISSKPCDIAEGTEVVFLALHGKYGEDGAMQGFLEIVGVRYTGSGVLSSALAFNKIKTKEIFKEKNIPTPVFRSLHLREWTEDKKSVLSQISSDFGFPVVIKAAESGSSHDMGIPQSREAAQILLDKIFAKHDFVLIEEFIKGDEFTCGILEKEGKAVSLPVTQIIPKTSPYFDFQAKYEVGGSDEITPASISAERTTAMQDLAKRSHMVLECRGYSRTDILLRNQELYVLEVNTLPGMTNTSLIPQEARAAGILYPELLDIIVANALEDKKKAI